MTHSVLFHGLCCIINGLFQIEMKQFLAIHHLKRTGDFPKASDQEELEDVIRDETSGEFTTALLAMLKANKDENTEVDMDLARRDAEVKSGGSTLRNNSYRDREIEMEGMREVK